MISVKQASEIVLKASPRQSIVRVALEDALGKVLAEDVKSDIDMPPFHRSMMDGYAVVAADTQKAPVKLRVVGYVPAGSFPKFHLQSGDAAKIMTGAPVPEGADAVREVEKTKELAHGSEVQMLEAVSNGQNIAPRGSEVKASDVVLPAGTYIHSAVVGLLAAVGEVDAKVFRVPQIAILATGDELVDPRLKPRQGQIRNSNSYALTALCKQMGLQPQFLGIAKDERSSLRNKIVQGMKHDVLLVTGGVSMGDRDYVGDILKELGVEISFEKVAIKPGKPFVFGKIKNKSIFALPGNPVSSSTVFEVFVRPALRKMMGFPAYQNPVVKAKLTEYFRNKSGRENYHPCVTWYENGCFYCRPLNTKGSGDIMGYARSNSYLICPIDKKELVQGQEIDVLLRGDYYLA